MTKQKTLSKEAALDLLFADALEHTSSHGRRTAIVDQVTNDGELSARSSASRIDDAVRVSGDVVAPQSAIAVGASGDVRPVPSAMPVKQTVYLDHDVCRAVKIAAATGDDTRGNSITAIVNAALREAGYGRNDPRAGISVGERVE